MKFLSYHYPGDLRSSKVLDIQDSDFSTSKTSLHNFLVAANELKHAQNFETTGSKHVLQRVKTTPSHLRYFMLVRLCKQTDTKHHWKQCLSIVHTGKFV